MPHIIAKRDVCGRSVAAAEHTALYEMLCGTRLGALPLTSQDSLPAVVLFVPQGQCAFFPAKRAREDSNLRPPV